MDNIGYVKSYEVIIVELGTNAETPITVKAGEDMSAGTFVIWCSLNDQEIKSVHDVYFTAFKQFRDKLLEAGYGIKCNGARINAATLHLMERSPEVYIVEPGEGAMPEKPVNIWDKADISEFPDSRQQNRFVDKWFRERDAIEARTARKASPAVKILLFAPLVPEVLWILALGITDMWNYRWGMAGIYLVIMNIMFYCLAFSLTIGALMVLIGTIVSKVQGFKAHMIFGVIEFIVMLLPYVYIFLMLGSHGMGWR